MYELGENRLHYYVEYFIRDRSMSLFPSGLWFPSSALCRFQYASHVQVLLDLHLYIFIYIYKPAFVYITYLRISLLVIINAVNFHFSFHIHCQLIEIEWIFVYWCCVLLPCWTCFLVLGDICRFFGVFCGDNHIILK